MRDDGGDQAGKKGDAGQAEQRIAPRGEASWIVPQGKRGENFESQGEGEGGRKAGGSREPSLYDKGNRADPRKNDLLDSREGGKKGEGRSGDVRQGVSKEEPNFHASRERTKGTLGETAK